MTKKHVMSLRLDDGAYRRLRAYASSRGIADSAAARELLSAGLARDGLELYSTELGAYLRGVMQPLIESFDDSLDRRNAEQEDRIARVVHRAARGSVVAAIASCELLKEAYPGLADVPLADVYAAYDDRARMVQAGMTLEEAMGRASG